MSNSQRPGDTAMHERLLIVEDDADMRDLLQEDLEQAGYSIVSAPDGNAALAFIERDHEPIDLVITDVQMPGLKGGELLDVVRQTRGDAPVIVITAFGSAREAAEMIRRGAFQYLTKPFESRTLLAFVAQALERSKLRRERARERQRDKS